MRESPPNENYSTPAVADLHDPDNWNKEEKESNPVCDKPPPPKEEEVCVICMDTMTNPKELSCKHKFCTECIEASFEQCQPKCPSCGQLFGVMKGNQPSGTMQSVVTSNHLGGYERFGCIETTYSFPDGTQEVYIYWHLYFKTLM